MLKPYLVLLTDVMPNYEDGKATVAHVVPLEFGYYCVTYYGWQVEQPVYQMLSHIVMNHVCRCYAKMADRIATHCKGLYYFNLRSEVLNRTSSQK